VNEEPRRSVGQDSLAFFGKIGADVSHEMRNVLSVIGENAGLLDDLVALADRKKPLDCARLKKLSASIARQVVRGTEAMERFSRFAHAADEPTASFDLAAVTRNMAALAQRRVTLAGCRLEAELPPEAIPLRADPFRLQHAVFAAIECVLGTLESGGAIRMQLSRQGPKALILLSGSAGGGAGEPSGRVSPQLSAIVDDLKGSVETSWVDGTLSLTLAIPIP
jgi:C4-dicarboxylate-specific signal transduction histidine kinase